MMERQRIHISSWLLAISFLLLAVSCSSSDSSEGQQPTMLTIYVFSPEYPTLIRGAEGSVDSKVEESTIHQLQIWIFESGTGEIIGYLKTEETAQLNAGDGATYQIPVDDDFAHYKPDVDIYVLANVTGDNCGCSFYDGKNYEGIYRDFIKDNAILTSYYFGLDKDRLCDAVPPQGLPMVGVLKNQSVIGDAPVLRIGTPNQIATVSLERAVSKVRFVFANTEGEPDLKIDSIKLDSVMIPDVEYLIPQSRTLTYNSNVADLWTTETTAVAVKNPTKYIYDGQKAQEYEDSIDKAGLTVIGPFYLHESDKRLKGTITYHIGNNAAVRATFQMAEAGDFMRNHTWIVYAYHAGGGFLQMNALYVKDWINKIENHEVYNW